MNLKSKQGDCLASMGEGKPPAIGSCEDAQVWQLFKDGQIKHRESGLCLNDKSADTGNMITMQPCNGSDQ